MSLLALLLLAMARPVVVMGPAPMAPPVIYAQDAYEWVDPLRRRGSRRQRRVWKRNRVTGLMELVR